MLKQRCVPAWRLYKEHHSAFYRINYFNISSGIYTTGQHAFIMYYLRTDLYFLALSKVYQHKSENFETNF